MLLKMCALTVYMDSATLFQPALGIPKHLKYTVLSWAIPLEIQSSSTWLIGRDITAKGKIKSEIMQIGTKSHVQVSGDLDFKLDFEVIKSTYSETLNWKVTSKLYQPGGPLRWKICPLGFWIFLMYYC